MDWKDLSYCCCFFPFRSLVLNLFFLPCSTSEPISHSLSLSCNRPFYRSLSHSYFVLSRSSYLLSSLPLMVSSLFLIQLVPIASPLLHSISLLFVSLDFFSLFRFLPYHTLSKFQSFLSQSASRLLPLPSLSIFSISPTYSPCARSFSLSLLSSLSPTFLRSLSPL